MKYYQLARDIFVVAFYYYSAFTDKVERNCHFRLPAGTAWLTAKRYKVLPVRAKYRSIKTIKSTYLFL
jgi:hypothetical protein